MFIQDYLKDVESLKRILIDSVDVSFSRSGGKGGQNVNKVNTKATLKLRIKDLRRSIPNYWIENLTKSHLYAPNSEMVIVQSSSTRSQSLNLRDCWAKIYQTFDSISKIGLIGETDQNKVKRISKLKDISKKRVLIQKQYRKSIKSNRSSPLS
ncbi:hypothetical protein BY996DRAFT_4587133 [Phakopsora pachyrhizi]|uniref:Prokaryotic-type class I peptide chain release factors domain-containing protein n=1 Tax=Phakopsora pachyrhizi TaxID=170000 RepID=A0AAV0AHC1_PHAPC|nr:hypothetical protein BY996DRAFT_4587133 [Phakopsora pachyrhizi]CAH7666444.1 hypothetical protein PPACK8108_LOCUS798 [Phakopsora pachyrhizi]